VRYYRNRTRSARDEKDSGRSPQNAQKTGGYRNNATAALLEQQLRIQRVSCPRGIHKYAQLLPIITTPAAAFPIRRRPKRQGNTNSGPPHPRTITNTAPVIFAGRIDRRRLKAHENVVGSGVWAQGNSRVARSAPESVCYGIRARAGKVAKEGGGGGVPGPEDNRMMSG